MKDIYEQLIEHEGLRTKPHVDGQGEVWLGVGRNLTIVGITRRQATQWLEDDVALIEAELSARLPWADGLSPLRRRVLIDLAFNVGVPRLLKFHATLEAIQAGYYLRAANVLLQCSWAKQEEVRARRLAYMLQHDVVPSDAELAKYTPEELIIKPPTDESKEDENENGHKLDVRHHRVADRHGHRGNGKDRV